MVELNFAFWMIIVCAIGALSIPFIILFLFGVRRKSRPMKWIGAIPAVGILVLDATVFCFLIYGFAHPWSETADAKTIRGSFVSNFGFQPGSDFVPLHQRIYCLADYGCMHLQFRVSSTTFERIRTEGFRRAPASSFFATTAGKKAPSWWISANHLSDQCYQNDRWKGSFHSNSAFLFYDNSSNTAYFFSQGID